MERGEHIVPPWPFSRNRENMCAKSLQISKWEIFLSLSPLAYISAVTEVTSFLASWSSSSHSMIALFEFELTKYVYVNKPFSPARKSSTFISVSHGARGRKLITGDQAY